MVDVSDVVLRGGSIGLVNYPPCLVVELLHRYGVDQHAEVVQQALVMAVQNPSEVSHWRKSGV